MLVSLKGLLIVANFVYIRPQYNPDSLMVTRLIAKPRTSLELGCTRTVSLQNKY